MSYDMSVDLKNLANDLEKLTDDLPEMRRQLHEEIGQVMKQEIDSAISSSVNDSGGHVRSWQVLRIGTGGGYAAISPRGGESGKNSPGAITNYLENGHKIRPMGNGKRYVPRNKVVRVSGRYFYQNTNSRIEAKIIEAAEKFCDKIARRIEGGAK